MGWIEYCPDISPVLASNGRLGAAKPVSFHDTVFANIRMARPQANRDQVVQASILAHAHEFIEKLPQDTKP